MSPVSWRGMSSGNYVNTRLKNLSQNGRRHVPQHAAVPSPRLAPAPLPCVAQIGQPGADESPTHVDCTNDVSRVGSGHRDSRVTQHPAMGMESTVLLNHTKLTLLRPIAVMIQGFNMSLGIQRYLFQIMYPAIIAAVILSVIPRVPMVIPAAVMTITLLAGSILWIKSPPARFMRSRWPSLGLTMIALSIPAELISTVHVGNVSVPLSDAVFVAGILTFGMSLRSSHPVNDSCEHVTNEL
jgi:hypothetical protein